LALSARLKSCPVTKPPEIADESSFSAACKADIDSDGFMLGLKPQPPSDVSFSAASESLCAGESKSRMQPEIHIPVAYWKE
jgi:hypothetical protein